MKNKKNKANSVKIFTKTEKHPAFGMWKNRKDMKDPVKYVRNIRSAG